MQAMTPMPWHGPPGSSAKSNWAPEGDDVVLMLAELREQLNEMQTHMTSEVERLQASVQAVSAVASSRSQCTERRPRRQNVADQHADLLPHAVLQRASDGADFDSVCMPLPAGGPSPDPPAAAPPALSGETEGECGSKDAIQEIPGPGTSSRATGFWHDRASELLNADGSAEASTSENPFGTLLWFRIWGFDEQLVGFARSLHSRNFTCRDLRAAFPLGTCVTVVAVILAVVGITLEAIQDGETFSEDEYELEVHKLRAFVDLIMVGGTLCSLMLYHCWHLVAKQAMSHSQEACLVAGLLTSFGSGCKPKWQRACRRQQRRLTLVWLSATALKVFLTIWKEKPGLSYDNLHLKSIIGFSCAAGLNTAIALRLTCTIQALKTCLPQLVAAFVGGVKLSKAKTDSTPNETCTALHWSSLEAVSNCMSTANAPVLLNMLIVAPMQVLAIVLESVMTIVSLKDGFLWLLPHAVMGLLPAYAIYMAADINRECQQIPSKFNACLVEKFRHPSSKDFLDFIIRTRPGVRIGDMRVNFTLVTRMMYLSVVLAATLVARQLQLELS